MEVTFKGYGTVTVELWPEIAPLACQAVAAAANAGKYDGRRVERLEPGYVLQPLFLDGDDPFLDALIELEAKTVAANGQVPFTRGIVAMAGTADMASAGQFFITLDTAEKLNGNFTVIGQVVDGWDVLEAVESVPVVEDAIVEDGESYPYHRPETDVVVERVIINE